MRRLLPTCTCAVLLAAAPAGAQITPATGEIVVATDADYPIVSSQADRGFVVTYTGEEVFARRYAPSGTPATGPVVVNDPSSDTSGLSSVASRLDGSFVVVWDDTASPSDYGVWFRVFAQTGAPLTPPTRAHDATSESINIRPDVTAHADGAFTLIWHRGGGGRALVGRRFTATGAPATPPIPLGESDPGSEASVAASPVGVVVTVSRGDRVYARQFDASLAPVGAEVTVNAGTKGATDHEVAADSMGAFVVAWDSVGSGFTRAVNARRFGSSGSPLTDVVTVAATAFPNQMRPAVASEGDGDFVVAWENAVSQSSATVLVRSFDAEGVPLSGDVPVSQTAGSNSEVSVAGSPEGDSLAATWLRRSGSTFDVIARRFAVVDPRPVRAAATVSLRRALRATRRGVIELELACPRQQASACSVTVGAQTARKVAVAKRRKRVLKLGRRSYELSQSSTETVRFKLSKKGRRQLVWTGRLRARFTARTNGVAGRSKEVVTLRPAKPKRRKKS